jgi:hypothetical protein
MSYETLRLIRNLLLRGFMIGIAITLILAAVTLCFWDTWMPLATTLFHADAATLTPIVLKFFVNIRFFLLYIVLMPALALHWTLKRDFGKKGK